MVKLKSLRKQRALLLFHILSLCACILAGCNSWQNRVADQNFIPLPTIAMVQLDGATTKPANALIGRSKILRPSEMFLMQDFLKPPVWVWEDTAQMTPIGFRVATTQGPSSVHFGGGFNLKLPANFSVRKVGIGNASAGVSAEVKLENIKSLQVKGDEAEAAEAAYSTFLESFVDTLLREGQSQYCAVITNALIGDVDDTTGVNVEVPVSLGTSATATTQRIATTQSATATQCAFAVQGQLYKIQLGPVVTNPLAIGKGVTSVDELGVTVVSDGEQLDVTLMGAPAHLYTGGAGGWSESKNHKVAITKDGTTQMLLGKIGSGSGQVCSLDFTNASGSTSLVHGTLYNISASPLTYKTFKDFAISKPVAAPALVDWGAWKDRLPPEAPIGDILSLQQTFLEVQPVNAELQIPLCEVVEYYAPSQKPKTHYLVRLLRYELKPGQQGKTFIYQTVKQGRSQGFEGQVFAESHGVLTSLAPGSRPVLWDNAHTTAYTIPKDVDHLVVRYALTEESPGDGNSDGSAFYGTRRAHISKVNWTAAFLPGCNWQAEIVAGTQAPDPRPFKPTAVEKLPEWTAAALKEKVSPEEEVLATVAKALETPKFSTVQFEVDNPGRSVLWLMHWAR